MLIDVNESNIAYCRQRFSNEPRVGFYVTSGNDISCCEDASISAIFCYDAMVHFEYDDVAIYLHEIRRVLKPGGMAVLHHSNNSDEPGKLYSDSTHGRNFMSIPLFNHIASRAALSVTEQIANDKAGARDLDALLLLRRS